MILNILNKSSRSESLDDCLTQISPGDALLLIEDGVLAAVDTPHNHQWLQRCPEGVALYTLREDAVARGVESHLMTQFHPVGYEEFVDLVAQFRLSQSWY